MTPIDQYIAVLNSSHRMSPAYEQFLREASTVKHLKSKEEILPLGHHTSAFYFVAKGLIYSWQLNQAGERIPVHFASENHFIGTVMHPLFPEHIPDGIACIEESIVVTGETNLAVRAVSQFEEARDLIHIVVNNAHRDLQKLLNIRLLHTPEERFYGFKAASLDLYNRVPQGLLASYLNMSRVYFNQLKNKRNP